MCKTKILLVMLALICATSIGKAEEGKLGVTFDVTYASRWLSHGVEVYSEDGAFFETVNLDLYGTGFGVSLTHTSATGGGWVDKQRLDPKVFYKNSLFDDQAYQTNYKFLWVHKTFYDRARTRGNIQEWNFGFSWPKLLGGGLVPKYTLGYCYPAGSGYDNCNISGFLHVLGLGYNLDVPQLPNPLSLSANATFRDGAGGAGKDHDWSHATLGISTKLKITDNLSFVPGLYYQISMDDSVCERDVTYCKLSMKYKF